MSDNTFDDAPNATAKNTSGAREVIVRSVTINRPVDEVYAFYRDLSNAPLYMEDIVHVEERDGVAHWVGKDAEWDSEITQDLPREELTWQAENSSGRAQFEDVAGRGTVLTFTTAYDQPTGIIGKAVGVLTQKDPNMQVRRTLRRLKQLLETGEIATNARTKRMHAEEKV